MKLMTVLAVALAAAVVSAAFPDAVDTKAPAISIKALNGGPVKIADARGKILLVDFWATWCTGCKESMPALDALAATLRDRGVEVLGVSVDESRKDLNAFLKERPAKTIRVLLDPQMTAADAFKVATLPSAFIIDGKGQIRFSHPGYGPEAVERFRSELLTLLEEAGR